MGRSDRAEFAGVALALATACSLGACGGDPEDEPAPVSVTVGERDGGRPVVPIAPPTPDAGVGHQSIVDRDRLLCTHDSGDLFELELADLGGSTALAGDARGFAMLYGGETSDVFVRALPLDRPIEDAVLVADSSVAPVAPLLGVSRERFLVVYRSALDGRLFSRLLAGGEPTDDLLADQVATDSDGGVLASVVGVDDGFVVGWVEPDGALVLQRLEVGGQVQDTRRLSGALSGARHLRLGQFDGDRLLVAWSALDDDGDLQIWAQAHAADLMPTAEPVALTGGAVPSGSRFDLAVYGDSAGVVFPAVEGGVREALKFRRIDPDGVASGPLLNIVNGPRRGVDGAIASFGQGYVVSYRLLPSPGEPTERVEVAFVNEFGAIIYRGSLGPTSAEGGPTNVATTPDGHVLTVWNAATAAGEAELRGAKLDCPAALVLCGGEVD